MVAQTHQRDHHDRGGPSKPDAAAPIPGHDDIRLMLVAPKTLARRALAELDQASSGVAADTLWASNDESAIELLAGRPDQVVRLLIIAAADGSLDTRVERLRRQAALAHALVLLLTEKPVHADLVGLLDSGRLGAVIRIPWERGRLARQVRGLIDREPTPTLEGAVRSARTTGAESAPDSALLRLLLRDARSLREQLLSEIEQALGPCPRLQLPEGIRLVREGAPPHGVFLIIHGSVALEQATASGERRLHHDSTGSLIGLLSLGLRQGAFFSARSTTPVEVIHLSLEQLDQALSIDPSLGTTLAAISVHALARRLRRADQLQLEKISLNQALERERSELADTLRRLELARLDLLEKARLATLGELSAGIAHDLNNPVAALMRAVSFLEEDLEQLFQDHPRRALIGTIFDAQRDRPPRSTAEERAARRVLEAGIGDSDLARRLVNCGIEDPDEAATLAADPRELALVEAAAGMGAALRNIQICSRRICELVRSLHAYTRPKDPRPEEADLHTGLEDTLRLLSHRLRDIEVERHYEALPRIRCYPGELEQLWTNLLVNACEALGHRGKIVLTTDSVDAEQVRVSILDNGPGIDPSRLAHVFEPQVTTKQGKEHSGLGLGLSIARRVVETHGGTIHLESKPGQTLVTVLLPVIGHRSEGDKQG